MYSKFLMRSCQNTDQLQTLLGRGIVLDPRLSPLCPFLLNKTGLTKRDNRLPRPRGKIFAPLELRKSSKYGARGFILLFLQGVECPLPLDQVILSKF